MENTVNQWMDFIILVNEFQKLYQDGSKNPISKVIETLGYINYCDISSNMATKFINLGLKALSTQLLVLCLKNILVL